VDLPALLDTDQVVVRLLTYQTGGLDCLETLWPRPDALCDHPSTLTHPAAFASAVFGHCDRQRGRLAADPAADLSTSLLDPRLAADNMLCRPKLTPR
jgi:hypothetical protein